jgi:hypothetical protein
MYKLLIDFVGTGIKEVLGKLLILDVTKIYIFGQLLKS